MGPTMMKEHTVLRMMKEHTVPSMKGHKVRMVLRMKGCRVPSTMKGHTVRTETMKGCMVRTVSTMKDRMMVKVHVVRKPGMEPAALTGLPKTPTGHMGNGTATTAPEAAATGECTACRPRACTVAGAARTRGTRPVAVATAMGHKVVTTACMRAWACRGHRARPPRTTHPRHLPFWQRGTGRGNEPNGDRTQGPQVPRACPTSFLGDLAFFRKPSLTGRPPHNRPKMVQKRHSPTMGKKP